MNITTKRRIAALEAVMAPGEDLPMAIFISRKSCRLGAPDYTDDDILAVAADGLVLDRLPGETLEELQARAEAVPPACPGSVRVWMMRYREVDSRELCAHVGLNVGQQLNQAKKIP